MGPRRVVPLLLAALSGCTLFAIGAVDLAVRQYQDGTATQDYFASPQDTWDATREEMIEQEIDFNHDFAFNAEEGARIPFRGGWVDIRYHPQDERYTRLRARFNADESRIRRRQRAFSILDGVDARLGGAGSPVMNR
ncbi:MAG: hypothetical protein AAGD14_16225 [Planctomycetota bacterium]